MTRALRRQQIRLHGHPSPITRRGPARFEEDPECLVRVLREFIAMHEPSTCDEDEIRRRLLAGAPA